MMPTFTSGTRGCEHYNDFIMSVIASQITSLTIVFSTICSDADQRKHHSSVSLAFVRGIHRWPVNSPHKGPVTRKMFRWHHHDMHHTVPQVTAKLSSWKLLFSVYLYVGSKAKMLMWMSYYAHDKLHCDVTSYTYMAFCLSKPCLSNQCLFIKIKTASCWHMIDTGQSSFHIKRIGSIYAFYLTTDF